MRAHPGEEGPEGDPAGEPLTLPAPPEVRARDPVWAAYLVLLALLSPFWGLFILWRLSIGRSRTGRLERMGLGPFLPTTPTGRSWIHGVSVGEVLSLAPVVRSLRELRPEMEVVVSAGTRTGWERAVESFGPSARVRFVPLDLPWAVRGALRRVRPDIVLLGESELWPSFLHLAARSGPVILVNGRVSDRTFRRAMQVRPLYRWLLGHLTAAGVQTEGDAERLRALGMSPARIRVTGNTKFDRAPPTGEGTAPREWRELLELADDPVLVAGSTFPGEEELLIRALLEVRRRWPGARLVVAPRDPRRAAEVLGVARARGLSARLRSGPPSDTRPAVVVVDTIGELASLYGAGELAFVGRSLLHGGGQNPIEPMAAGKPVLHGPRMESFRQVVEWSRSAGASREVSSGKALAEAWHELLSDPALRERMGDAGRALIARHRGAARRCALLTIEVLERGKPRAGDLEPPP